MPPHAEMSTIKGVWMYLSGLPQASRVYPEPWRPALNSPGDPPCHPPIKVRISDFPTGWTIECHAQLFPPLDRGG